VILKERKIEGCKHIPVNPYLKPSLDEFGVDR